MMKSKTEMADALQICMSTPDCKRCVYLPDVADESRKCCKEMIDDIFDTLIKSDFEVMKEILERSEEYHNDYSYEIQGNDYPTIILHRGTQMLWVDFDNKGSIL